MDKITYLAELAEGLARWVPERERQDILRYYAEYFEEAGPGRETEVVAELGDPWALSCRLAVEGGYVTHEKAASWSPRKKWPRALIGTAVGLTVFALVALIGIGLLGINLVRTASSSEELVFAQVLEDPSLFADQGYIVSIEGWDVIDSFFSDAGSLKAFSSIDADISVGNIQVVAGDGYTLSVLRGEALSGYAPEWEIRDGVLKLRDGDLPRQAQISGWDDLKNLFNVNHWSMEVIITVPENAALDNINVETGVGNVMLWGVSAGTVTAETGVGNVECYEARNVRKLELNTGVGDVGLILYEAGPGLNIRLESGTGNVEVSLCGDETDYAYTLESGIGHVSVNGFSRGSEAKRGDSAPYSLYAESGTGNVNVYFAYE